MNMFVGSLLCVFASGAAAREVAVAVIEHRIADMVVLALIATGALSTGLYALRKGVNRMRKDGG